MAFQADYGETLATEEEREALTARAREVLGEPIRKADLYDLEQQIQDEIADDLMGKVFAGSLTVSDLLTDHFVRDLHRRLYALVWMWGGRQRSRETNIGIAPERIAVELRSSLESLLYRFRHQGDLTPRALGIAAHAAIVHIHPFIDGNGRVTRLLADLVFVAAQEDGPMLGYDWDVDREIYIRLLRQYDRTLDPTDLVEFIPVFEPTDER
ncbi:hypothetical protein BST33_10625 [Mycolicibacter minnesotensis]|uniref:Uncharacterized protein n=1 Tax=Mycolicibacter minnesotensis TaxID=1118379 RepID=A0A7I7R784_9MYCO|nr:Fic family protein [Mycolicibacter minnesotensis]ORB00779.1 hypothetical protein BST33_10625 [Mycolicibacter minnesotensis]BBY34519.1 hypothetical protein MMIN_25800 [Mycolicibacter minnesotensis]